MNAIEILRVVFIIAFALPVLRYLYIVYILDMIQAMHSILNKVRETGMGLLKKNKDSG